MKQATFRHPTIEDVREFWNRRPCNVRHSSREIGSQEYFDEVEARKYFVEPHIPRFAEFERWRDREVLEVGCGIGTDTINFARNGARVTAVELSERSLDLARRRAKIYGLEDKINFYQANAEEMTKVVPVKPYDLIYSFGVIHHTPRPERVLEQIGAYTNPGSTIKVMVYHRQSWKVLWILLRFGKGQFWRAAQWVARYSEAQEGCPVTFTYTRDEIRELLRRHDFEVTDLWVDHIFPYRVADYLQYRYRRVWYFRLVPGPLFRRMERRWGWHLCVTAKPSGCVSYG